MKVQLFSIIVAGVMLFGAGAVQAGPVWESGHHIITGDYHEVQLFNDATVEILSGYIGSLETYDTSMADILGGEMFALYAYDNSAINLHGGQLSQLLATDNSQIYLYAYDVDLTENYVQGKYFVYDIPFQINLHDQSATSHTYSHITIVPEPCTILLLGFGGLILTRHKHKKVAK